MPGLVPRQATECRVASVRVAVAVAAVIENSVSLHSHSSHIKPTVQEEDMAAKARVLVLVRTALWIICLLGLRLANRGSSSSGPIC